MLESVPLSLILLLCLSLSSLLPHAHLHIKGEFKLTSQSLIYTRHQFRNDHLSQQTFIRPSDRCITHPVDLSQEEHHHTEYSSIASSNFNADHQHELDTSQRLPKACLNNQEHPHFFCLLKSFSPSSGTLRTQSVITVTKE